MASKHIQIVDEEEQDQEMEEGDILMEEEAHVPQTEEKAPQLVEVYPVLYIPSHDIPPPFEGVQDGEIRDFNGKKVQIRIVDVPHPQPAKDFLKGTIKIGIASVLLVGSIILHTSGFSDIFSAFSGI